MDEWLKSDVNLTFGTSLWVDLETCRACGWAVRIIARIDDPVLILKAPNTRRLTTKPANPSRYPKAGRRLERCLVDATVFIQPRMLLPGGKRQDTGWSPA